MNNVKAIETEYKGYRFRSRLEARWAVFLDGLGVNWEYEKEGFELMDGRYLPDFWLPRMNLWLEIKGEEPTRQETNFCRQLAHGTDKPVAIATGLPSVASKMSWENPEMCYFVCERMKVYCGTRYDWEGPWPVWHDCFWGYDCEANLKIGTQCGGDFGEHCTPESFHPLQSIVPAVEIYSTLNTKHLDMAKSARFEFGESGESRRSR